MGTGLLGTDHLCRARRPGAGRGVLAGVGDGLRAADGAGDAVDAKPTLLEQTIQHAPCERAVRAAALQRKIDVQRPTIDRADLDTVFWINSGAEANENALKLAFKITGRTKAVALEQSFHGRTAAAGAGSIAVGY